MDTDPCAIQVSNDLKRDNGATSPQTPFIVPHPDIRPAARLMDWRGFHTELQRAAITATQTSAPLSLLMLEQVGSQPHGCEVAAVAMGALADAVRAAVGGRGLLARYSEGRLAVILIDTDLGEAVGRAECIALQVSSARRGAAGRVDLNATAAIGIAQFEDEESLGHLIQRTAEALKQAGTHRGFALVADHAAVERSGRMRAHVRFSRPNIQCHCSL